MHYILVLNLALNFVPTKSSTSISPYNLHEKPDFLHWRLHKKPQAIFFLPLFLSFIPKILFHVYINKWRIHMFWVKHEKKKKCFRISKNTDKRLEINGKRKSKENRFRDRNTYSHHRYKYVHLTRVRCTIKIK